MPEITWSLMHPTPLDVDYMKRVIREAEAFHVDSFEICSLCHSPLGGMDGLVLFEDYPLAAAAQDREAVLENRRKLKEILALAHASGRPVYYWHREVTAAPAVLDSFPGLLDEKGEFDLLGEAFEMLLRYKLRKTFEAVPELDGIVLTLTEADFSAIHNSTPDVYPPEKVVERVVRIFAGEHRKLGKRMILRSFGSIAQDYQEILGGAAQAAKEFSFEVETKITPYDFSPFMPDNPFMRPIPHLTMGAECDCLGEFLGAGYLPAENVKNIVRYVRYAQKCGVDRYAIRLDRIGHNVFDSYPINLFAYHRAIEAPELTAEEIIREYAESREPAGCRETLRHLGEEGFAFVERLNYVDHNVIFHPFPPPAGDLKWLKAGGIFTVFADGAELKEHSGLWGILFRQKTPGRRAIVREKEEALAIAEKALSQLESIRTGLPEAEYRRLAWLWGNARIAAVGMLHFIRCIAAYFDDMASGDASAGTLRREIGAMTRALGTRLPKVPLCLFSSRKSPESERFRRLPLRVASSNYRSGLFCDPDKNSPSVLLAVSSLEEDVEIARKTFSNGQDHSTYSSIPETTLDVYFRPMLANAKVLLQEYEMDFAARRQAKTRFPDGDFVLPGTLPDEIRCIRNMHASHALVQDGKLGRFVGNPVFPNGFLKITLRGTGKAASLFLEGKGNVLVTVQDRDDPVRLEDLPVIPLPAASEYAVTFRKNGREYPWLSLVAVQ